MIDERAILEREAFEMLANWLAKINLKAVLEGYAFEMLVI